MSTYAPVLVTDRSADPLADSTWQPNPTKPLPASSPLATATAVSALLLAEQHDISFSQLQALNDKAAPAFDTAYQGDLSELIVTSLHWLAHQQHADGGWGEDAASELATTMLVRAAFQITGVPVQYADLVERADTFVKAQDGITGLRTQCDYDKSRIAPILASCAVAGSISWRQVPALPFERICLPSTWTTRFHLTTECSASPSALAVGLAKFHHDPPRNPIMRVARQWASNRVMPLLQQAQSGDGSFLDSIPQTSFIVMNLASMGHAHLPVVRRGVEFLFASLRPDGSWPLAAIATT
jgi:squalene-hopene/tetraprenyl-beta-curcumene cyclase